MRTLLLIAVIAVVLIGLLVLAGKVMSRTVVRANADRGAQRLGPAQPGEVEERAALLAPERGFGTLRLTPTELLFAGGTDGLTIRVPRISIRAAEAVTTVHGETLHSPALSVTRQDGAPLVLAVTDVPAWIERLR